MVDVMPTLLALAGGKGSPDHPFDGKDMWETLAEGAPSPNEDMLINVEAFPRRGSQGRLEADQDRAAAGQDGALQPRQGPRRNDRRRRRKSRDRPRSRSAPAAYAKEQKPSLWIKAQPAFVGAQGKTVIDPDFDIDDGGLPHEKAAMPN